MVYIRAREQHLRWRELYWSETGETEIGDERECFGNCEEGEGISGIKFGEEGAEKRKP